MRHWINLMEYLDDKYDERWRPTQQQLNAACGYAESYFGGGSWDEEEGSLVYSFDQFADDVSSYADNRLHDEPDLILSSLDEEQLKLIWQYGTAVEWQDMTVAGYLRWASI